MSERICRKCGAPIPDGSMFCTSCGNRVEKQNVNKPLTVNEKNYDVKGIAVAIIALLGIIVMYTYRAWLGGLIFLAGLLFAIVTLKTIYENTKDNGVFQFLKTCLTQRGIGEKIMTVVIIIAPIVLCVATYRWLIVDTINEVDAMYDAMYYGGLY